MIVKQYEIDHPADTFDIGTVDECEPTSDFCMANIGVADDPKHYLSCGEKLYRRKNGVTYCTVHGDMH